VKTSAETFLYKTLNNHFIIGLSKSQRPYIMVAKELRSIIKSLFEALRKIKNNDSRQMG